MEKGTKRIPEIIDGEIVRTETGSIKGVGGKPPGSKNKTTLFKAAMKEGFEKRLEKDGLKVFDAVVQKAIGPPSLDKEGNPLLDAEGKQMYIDGDTTAMKILMDRIIPVTKAGDTSGDVGKFAVNISITGTKANIDSIEAEDADFEDI